MKNKFQKNKSFPNYGNIFIDVWTEEQWQEVKNSFLTEHPKMKWQLIYKRLLDIILASIAIFLLLPVLLTIALAVKLTSPGPILFCQTRLGTLGKPFVIYKFRTMVDGAINLGAGLNTFRGDPRVTPIGKFLREYHLDELPQLFNILRGDMSLVGPRPLLVASLFNYSDWQKKRLLMLPGLTAWEAVNGGLDNSLEQRINFDVWYVDNWSFWLDILIILRTIPVVLRKEGVYIKDANLSDSKTIDK
ncbi:MULTISPECIES: sugar transferase [unclassified Tolypothrix]|uniref:sugar transferase n=1 Tax=unclassified Tolypothrix TaxID=2649714 RepID=UPI0005EAB5DB|nr:MULTISPECIES: sugar transferase [unclassified Tolypothrix]BAY90311.1 sugar transferase [Microchaete diplosiphon NIES-3275]EKE98872.1 bacterial sugar transferase [Tolypothrix sp. PCC 7601]MBE9087506.1 sugar transferase [Tolypothrix sp. LEGE 11397]UYD24494.1 sugar transferase [Tolypothrix sp. PCC 7712]UYD33275.1 sugar transferase [Tolypothrix sp. PCC 7601]